MDNDVHGTDYCIGFSTAVTRSVEFIHQLRTSTGSHERIAVVELFGRYSGETSLITAYLAGVDRAIISEVPFDPRSSRRCSWRTAPQPQPLRDGDGLRGRDLHRRRRPPLRRGGRVRPPQARRHRRHHGEMIKELTGQDIISQKLGYLMRSGAPTRSTSWSRRTTR
jgi:ATP-dependent phosphofructokinase / diphosphate-dependent phosphofructokinase